MKKILILLALLAFTAGTAAAQSNISRLKGTYFQLSAEGDRGFGAGLSAGAGHVFGNGFSLSAGLGGEWNQRPNVGNNFFVTAYGEAKYSFLKTTVSPFLAARIKLRYLIPSHIQTGIETGQFYCNATQFDLFGLGIAGVDLGRFSIWGGIGGGPSFFTEERKDAESLKVTSSSQMFMDLLYEVGLTYWF